MKNLHIGFLHPGEMGISLAVSAMSSGLQACWVSRGRSQSTRNRATSYQLEDTETLQHMCASCPVIISICPPHAAEAVASEVVACGFNGLYVDANAISPQRTENIGTAMSAAGITFVDGGIIGPPAWKPGTTWLYLSGQAAHQVVDCFATGPLSIRVIGDQIGKASALKMCFAAKAKGTTAMLIAILAAAEELGVRKELETQWTLLDPEFVTQTKNLIGAATAKAWRFSGEMEEIAATLQAAGVPDNFHQGAREVYDRLAHYKDAAVKPQLEEVLQALLKKDEPAPR